MTWVKLDDQFFNGAKAQRAGKEGRALYLAGLCWCAANLTDGVITSDDLRFVAAAADVRQATYRKLVEVGLWEEHPDGFLVHDFLEYNPPAEQVREARRRDADRKKEERRRGGLRKPSDKSPPGRPNGLQAESRSPTPAPQVVDTSSPSTNGCSERETSLERRLMSACTGGRVQVCREAPQVVEALRRYLSDHVIDEAIGYCGSLQQRPVLPRYMLTVLPDWAKERGVTMPDLKWENGRVQEVESA